MDHWSRNGRPTLIAALQAACDTVEEGLANEFQQRDEERTSLLEEVGRLKSVAARVDQLENENHALVRNLDELRRRQMATDAERPVSSAGVPTVPGKLPLQTARPALAELSANSKISTGGADSAACKPGAEPDWEKEYTRLAVRHRALEKRHNEYQGKARQYRESRDSWKQYAESLVAKIERLEKKLQRNDNPEERVARTSAQFPTLETYTDDVLSGQTALGSSTTHSPEPAAASESRHGGFEEPTVGEKATAAPETGLPRHARRTADEETQDGSDGADELPPLSPNMNQQSVVIIKEEPSSDPPVVVFERKVRKRKHADDDSAMPAPPRRIKSEQSTGSDPVITGEIPVFRPHESMDLDEEGDGIPTPRKPRASEHQHRWDEDVEAFTEDEPRVQRRSAAGAVSIKEPLNTPSRGLNGQFDLAPASGPSTKKPSRPYRDNISPIKAAWTLSSGVADVAEETPESFYAPSPRQAEKGSAHQTPAQGRLHSLLNHGSPSKTGGSFSPARPGTNEHDKENAGRVAPGKKVHLQPGVSAVASPTFKASPATSLRRRARDRNQPTPGRLRDRPLVDLRPEDFKVNPKSNNGYRFAFDEVVRGRDERAELAGCTDPNCCGRQFRLMAESELSAGGPGILSRANDSKMMEDYLGDEAYRLANMTREERRETWLKAKIQDLANRYGRHRHRFARRPSPPGYWNPDFPSTQEIEKSKEEAERVERNLVEERWREAMRGGGRWLFRDE